MARKKKTTGASTTPEAFKGAVAASEAKGRQTRIQIDMRDVRRVQAEHEVPRPMSDAAFKVASAQTAREHNKIKRIQAEIKDFKYGKRCTPQGEPLPSRDEEIKALEKSTAKLDREVEEECHLILTPCIELHDVNRATVTIYVDDNGEPGEKVKERRMTPEERKKAEEASPFEPPDGGDTIAIEADADGTGDDDADGEA
jgi:hypothetical protein